MTGFFVSSSRLSAWFMRSSNARDYCARRYLLGDMPVAHLKLVAK